MKPLPQGIEALVPYIQSVEPYLHRYGYLAVFFGVLLEDFGLPVPGETILIAGALIASLGEFRLEWIMALGFLGAVTGDNIGYAIGRFGGRKLVARYGRYVFLSKERLRKMESFFERHGGKVVVAARFIEGFRQFNGIVAGISGMAWRRFLAFNVLGAAIWVGFWGTGAYFFGSELGGVFAIFKRFEPYVLGVLGALVIILLARRYLRSRRQRRNEGG
ncbi:MAG: DedA family protein [Nitrospirota bacterium]